MTSLCQTPEWPPPVAVEHVALRTYKKETLRVIVAHLPIFWPAFDSACSKSACPNCWSAQANGLSLNSQSSTGRLAQQVSSRSGTNLQNRVIMHTIMKHDIMVSSGSLQERLALDEV